MNNSLMWSQYSFGTVRIRRVRVGQFGRGIVLREELPRRNLRHLIARPLGQDRGDQDLERVLRLRDDLRQGRLARMEVTLGQISAGEIPHDDPNALTGERRGGQGPPPPCKSNP